MMNRRQSSSARRRLRRTLQARAMRVLNVPMRVILNLPFATPLGRRLMLVFLTGRRTGRSYRQPVSYIREGSTLLTPAGGNWKLNLVDGRQERIRLMGHDMLARPELVADIDEVERLLDLMMQANPAVGAFVGIPRAADGRLDRANLQAALQYGFRIVRWRLEEPRPAELEIGRGTQTKE